MDPIRLLLSLILGLFPRLLHFAAIPLATVSRINSRQQLRDYAIGHDFLGWYRVTLEVRHIGWPALRVIAISEWSRSRPGQKGKTPDNFLRQNLSSKNELKQSARSSSTEDHRRR
jgi:hypothetical protein